MFRVHWFGSGRHRQLSNFYVNAGYTTYLKTEAQMTRRDRRRWRIFSILVVFIILTIYSWLFPWMRF